MLTIIFIETQLYYMTAFSIINFSLADGSTEISQGRQVIISFTDCNLVLHHNAISKVDDKVHVSRHPTISIANSVM